MGKRAGACAVKNAITSHVCYGTLLLKKQIAFCVMRMFSYTENELTQISFKKNTQIFNLIISYRLRSPHKQP